MGERGELGVRRRAWSSWWSLREEESPGSRMMVWRLEESSWGKEEEEEEKDRGFSGVSVWSRGDRVWWEEDLGAGGGFAGGVADASESDADDFSRDEEEEELLARESEKRCWEKTEEEARVPVICAAS